MSGDNSDSTIAYLTFWLLAVLCLMIGPCVVFPRSRIICWKRIQQRRWNVSTDDIEEMQFRDRGFRPRYPVGDPRHIVTKEEAEKAKRTFLFGKLKDYTMVRRSIDVHS